jgi:hypothetical protein
MRTSRRVLPPARCARVLAHLARLLAAAALRHHAQAGLAHVEAQIPALQQPLEEVQLALT